MDTGPPVAAEQEASSKFWGNSRGDMSEGILNWRDNDFLTDISRHIPMANIVPGLIRRVGSNYSQQENGFITDDQPMMNDVRKPITLNEQRRRLLVGQGGRLHGFAQTALGLAQANPLGDQLLKQYGQGNMSDQTKNDVMARVLMQDAFVNNLIPNIADGVRQGLIPQAQPAPAGNAGANAGAQGPQAPGNAAQAPQAQNQGILHAAGLANRPPMFGRRNGQI